MHTALALAVAVSLCLGACTDDDGLPQGGPLSPAEPSAASSPSGGRPDDFDARAVELSLEVVAEGLAEPLGVVDPGDGSDRLFVVEQDGLIKVLRGGDVSEQPFLDLSTLTEGVGEQGLLGLAFHPDYSSNGRFFVDYTDLNGDTVVAEYRASEDPERANPASARVLLAIDQPFSNHNGGHMVFGPDGFLYIGMGDGGSGGDPQGNGQRLDTLLGKLLRIDVDSRRAGAPYGIPPDNPFVDRSGARPEIWAYGLRNPWRFSFDPAGEELWIGDVGQEEFEEIDRASDQAPGLNYGWNVMEGSACFSPPSDCEQSELVLPVTEYTHEHGCSVTGGFVYRGRRFPSLVGGYLFADFCSGTIWGIDAGAKGPVEPVELLQTELAISSFGTDAGGELYVTDLSGGTVSRVMSRTR